MFRNDLPEMKRFLQSKPANTQWIVQKYIEKPLLYHGRKFDIRVWAVATWKRELFGYRSGYVRTSSQAYTLDSGLVYVHLTNNCLQQLGNRYGAFEEGNTLGYDKFIQYLGEQFPKQKLDFEGDIVARMKDLMIDSYLATKHELNPRKRANCFELLGFDFMIDEDFRVWLIEVNSNPYLGVPNKYIEGLLPKMVNDMMELVLDPHVQPTNRLPEKERQNQFELLYSERRGLSQRRGYDVSLYPVLERAAGPVQKAVEIKVGDKEIKVRKSQESPIARCTTKKKG